MPTIAPPGTSGPAGTPSAAPSATSPVSQAGKAVEVHRADQLQVPQQNVDLAKASTPTEHQPQPAQQADVDKLRSTIGSPDTNGDGRGSNGDGRGSNGDGRGSNGDGRDPNGHDPHDPGAPSGNPDDHGWDHHVRQFDRDWVQYDNYYRPIICNPYNDTLQVIYVYQDQSEIVDIPPLASALLDVADYGAYAFTAVVTDAVGAAIDVAVGGFYGGGYDPGPDLAPPPPPPPLVTYDDVPVQVDYPDATYQPFVVNQVVDAGNDPQYGEDKVLLDGATPVWGQWTQTPDGQRQFDVHKTQQFPGLDTPAPGPLPGDYQLALANNSNAAKPPSGPPSGFTTKDVFVIAACSVVATLALSTAIGLGITRRRVRRH